MRNSSPKKVGAKVIRKPLSQLEKMDILTYVGKGHDNVLIGKLIGRDESVVRRFRQRAAARKSIEDAPRSGRPRKMSGRMIRQMYRAVESNRRLNAEIIREQFQWYHLSVWTIRRRMKEHPEFFSTLQSKRSLINEKTRQKRIAFCKRYENWTKEDWEKVLFSDESPFTIHSTRRGRCYKKYNEPLHFQCVVPVLKHDQKINVWGCFAYDGVGHLYHIKGNENGNMDAKCYHSILVQHMIPSAQMLFGDNYLQNFVFQQDNDPKHTARINKAYLANKNVECLQWPPHSPDLNPIENLWTILKWNTRDRRSKDKETLMMEDLQLAWRNLDPQVLRNLVHSMPTRIKECLKNNGMWIKY